MPGASFISPNTPLREAITQAAIEKVMTLTYEGNTYRPLYEVVKAESLVNAVVGLLATGGSTNHTLHLVAMAAAAGLVLTWEDINELSDVVPLLTRIYPNGQADINHFHQAGGMSFLFRELRRGHLLNENVVNLMGEGLDSYELTPKLNDEGKLVWGETDEVSGDATVLAKIDKPFSDNGGLKLLEGNLGKSVIKISAVAEEHHVIEAPCRVFSSQSELKDAFDKGELFCDVIAVVRFQGPAANGMPELHKMTPLLGVAQGKGYKVALVTDGRMSGASGKVPAAIHLSPEAKLGGLIGKVKDGDILRLDAQAGELILKVSEEELASREQAQHVPETQNLGRDLFENMRAAVQPAELGGGFFITETHQDI